MLTFGVLTVSTTCSKRPEKDSAGPKLEAEISQAFPESRVTFRQIVTDDKEKISNILKTVASISICDVLFTVGGTGFAPSDVTPEATKEVIEKEAPGLSHVLISKSLEVTDMAMLSRPVCGIRNRTIILNFPGSAKAAVECFGFVKSSLSHAVALIKDNMSQVEKKHKEIQTMSGFSKVQVKAGSSRIRKSEYPLIEVEDAKNKIFNIVSIIEEIETIPVEKALTRILAENIVATAPVPPFQASMKDGYAVMSADGVGKRRVRSAIAAGDQPEAQELQPGEVIRISTGAAIPAGADAVVQVEDTSLVEVTEDGKEEKIITVNVPPTPGQDIRQIGSDIQENTIVLEKHSPISAPYMGVLASLGYSEVKVVRGPSVGIISTGNELVNTREPLKLGQIYDSNKVALMALLESYGYYAADCGIARDTPDSVKITLERALISNDLIISSGGVSMGEYDLLKQVLIEDFGATIHFGRLNMKPGKPTVFATLEFEGRTKLVFALPGNPVSCCVTSLLFVIPTLKHMESDKFFKGWPIVCVQLEDDIVNRDTRIEYVRMKVYRDSNNKLLAVSTGNQLSSRLNSMVNANGLLCTPGQSTLKKGEIYNVYLFGQLY